MEENKVPTTLDQLRSNALKVDADEGEFVVHNGCSYEVRPPTLNESKAISRKSTDAKTKEVDGFRASILGVIACTFEPGTDNRIFNAADEEKLMAMRPGRNSLLTKLMKAMQRVQKVDLEEEEKN